MMAPFHALTSYGAGFWYIPGTETCFKIGADLRVDTTFNGAVYDLPFWNGDGGQGNRFADRINGRSRLSLQVDTRNGICGTGFGSLWSLRAYVVSGRDFGGSVSVSKNPVPGSERLGD
jgi:hypothetical protein